MTRTYAAKRLFEHGPLTFTQFVEETGWTPRQCTKTLEMLMKAGLICFTEPLGSKRIYALAV